MLLSIIIPAYNEEKSIADSVNRLFAACRANADLLPESDFEIIVVDNNSSDRTGEIARGLGARVVFEPHNQIARARNQGAAAAQGQWLLFVDADSLVSDALFRDLLGVTEAPDSAAAGAVIAFSPDADKRMRTGAKMWNALSRLTRWMAGSLILCRADLFREIGGFDERFYAAEEVDLSRRLKKIARKKKLKVRIIAKHPLITSDRKSRLYSNGELLKFFLRVVFLPFRTVRSRKGCSIWYDGKR
jgi:glycosyltransferase involved in cell wall biosynthesis